MTTASTAIVRPPAPPRGRYRHRVLEKAGGSRFVLNADGSIEHVPGDGGARLTWSPDDPEWPRQALRFGLKRRVVTVKPSGRDVGNLKARG